MAEIKTPDYDIPVRELPLGGGAVKLLPATPPAAAVDSRGRLTLCVLGRGIREGSVFRPPSTGLDELPAMFDGAEQKLCSARDARFAYSSLSGAFLPLERLIERLYGAPFSLVGAAVEMPQAVLRVTSGGQSCRIALCQLAEGKRYYFPQLTSEQVLSGTDPASVRGGELGAGLMLTGSGRVFFVLGQLGWNDITAGCIVELDGGGAEIALENLSYLRTRHNVLFAGPLGGTVSAHEGRGCAGVRLSLPGGTLLRFNLDCDDFLNSARCYYKFAFDGVECGEPSPTDGFVYNTCAPLYCGSGADYPTGVILPGRDVHKSMQIKMLAHGMEYPDSEVDVFNIEIV